jgi:hypothetical protein
MSLHAGATMQAGFSPATIFARPSAELGPKTESINTIKTAPSERPSDTKSCDLRYPPHKIEHTALSVIPIAVLRLWERASRPLSPDVVLAATAPEW